MENLQLENKMKYLTVTNEEFFKAYNDYLFCYNYTTDYNGFEYLSWSAAYVLLKKYYPTYSPMLEINEEDNDYIFKVQNNLVDRGRLSTRIKDIEDKLEVTKDYKEKKKLLNELDDAKNQLLYDNRGLVLKPYLLDTETGLRTPSIYFPVMSNTMSSVFNSDSRELTDNIQRAYVKVIAVQTGLALRLYSREALTKPVDGKPQSLELSDNVRAIKAIVERSEILNLPIPDFVHFGTSFIQLKKYAQELKLQLPKEIND